MEEDSTVHWIMTRANGDRTKVGALVGVVCIALNVLLCL